MTKTPFLISILSPSPTDGARLPPGDAVPDDAWTAEQVLDGAGELLAHLARSGIRFVPQSTPSGVEQWAESFAGSGSEEVSEAELLVPASAPVSPVAPALVAPAPVAPAPVAVLSTTGMSEPYTDPPLPVAERAVRLAALAQTVAGCTQCKALAGCRTQTVFGEGSPQPRFVFLGEAPGAEEDKTGRPFVDKAGQLLTKMIEAMRLKREDVYLLNTVKCRPPGKRNPEQDEIANCRPFFESQLELLRPEYIVCLGAVSSHALLNTKLSIGQLRHQFHQYRESKVMVIYHPVYLDRHPDAKRAAWTDLQILMKDAGL